MDGMNHTARPGLAEAAFAPLTIADHEAARAIPSAAADYSGDADSLDLLPCPEQHPARRCFVHWQHGEPAHVWLYRDAAGSLLCAVARYDMRNADGTPALKQDRKRAKAFAPWVYGRRVWTGQEGKQHDRTGWHCKAPPPLRPLYGLDRLAARPDAPVLVVEGEKASDEAGALFPDYVAISPMNGAEAPGKAAWAALAGRSVAIWPDNDTAGADFAGKVTELATRAGAEAVRVVAVPTDWPTGWDLADPPPENVPLSRVRELLDDAPDGTAPEVPDGFRLTEKGLFHLTEPSKNNRDALPTWIAAPFQVVGQTRSDTGEAWGLLLRWRDREGRPHQWAIPRRMIHEPGNEIAAQLEHAGLSCGSDGRAHELLKRFIGAMKAPRLLRCVTRTGWHSGEAGPVFALPGGEAFGPRAADVILQSDHAGADLAFRAAGNLASWQREVAALAHGNDRLVLFVSAAFAGPLLDILGEPSGGLHLVGHTRTGKSACVRVAGSVWGKPTADAQVRSWRATANGLEGVAAETSDTLLILDEMGQADAREVGDIVYMLGNEAGKQRASRTGTARRRQSWRTLFLSTGEVTLAQKMGEAGKRAMAGLETRLVSMPADAGAGMGVFQNLHGRPGAGALAEELDAAVRAHYGTAARAFLARLARDRAEKGAELREALSELRAGFIAKHVPVGATGQVRSVGGRFALIAAAGELARDYGVLPWPEGEALRAAGACCAAWLAARGGAGPAEDAAALAQVRAFLEAHGESRFTLLVPNGTDEPAAPEMARTVNRAGFRQRAQKTQEERWEYWILPETWNSEVCRGLDPKRTAGLLAERAWLVGADARNRSTTVNIPGEGKRRVYRVSGAILGVDGADGSIDGAV